MLLALVFALIVFSEAGFKASLSGLRLFLDVVLPSLLPFFILSELLLSMGVVHFLGVLFEPVMRPLFNVPGEGSFVLSMGLAAGYPMDAVITARMRREGMCTRIEAERMLAFTNTADPLFLFGAVAVGMFGMPALGGVLALAHYAGAFVVGLAFRFWGRSDRPSSPSAARAREGMWRAAARALLEARVKDGRPIGTVLGDAIRDAISTLFMIMSFIMLFSVILTVVEATGAMGLLTHVLGAAAHLVGVPSSLVAPAIKGIFEIDIGSAGAAAAHAPLAARLAMASAIIAWSGLSVHSQVASVLSGTDISMRPYFLARALHAVVAFGLTYLGFVILGPAVPALAGVASQTAPPSFLPSLGWALGAAVTVTVVLMATGLLVGVLRRSRVLVALRPFGRR